MTKKSKSKLIRSRRVYMTEGLWIVYETYRMPCGKLRHKETIMSDEEDNFPWEYDCDAD